MNQPPRPVRSRCLAALAMTVLAGCDRAPATAPLPPAPSVTPAPPANPTPPADDVKIMTEFWEGTNTIKFRYEMRKGADGRYARNGFSQAFYMSGVVEREGHYRDNERVGPWKYYDTEGKLLRTEERPDAKFQTPPVTSPPAK